MNLEDQSLISGLHVIIHLLIIRGLGTYQHNRQIFSKNNNKLKGREVGAKIVFYTR